MRKNTLVWLFVLFGMTSSHTASKLLPSFFISPMTSSVTSLIRNSRNFSVSLLNNLVVDSSAQRHQKNVFFSPLGVSNVLAMLRLASAGKTREELNQLVLFKNPYDVNMAFESLNNLLTEPLAERRKESANELLSANLIFCDVTLDLSRSYIAKAFDYFSAIIKPLDFKNSPEVSSNRINSWVDYITLGHIKRFFGLGDITANTQVVLVNTVFFRNVWKKPFVALHTRNDRFQLLNGTKILVPMMNQRGMFRHKKICSYQNGEHVCENSSQPDVIEIPFREDNRRKYNRQKLVILLPNDKISLEEIEERLHDEVDKWRMDMDEETINLSIPRCRIQYDVNLKYALQNKGLRRMFQEGAANLTLLVGKRISVAKFSHKATIVLNESGMLASSASGAVSIFRSSFPRKNFHVDRPFVFFIEDDRTGMMLFLGQVVDPR